MSLREEAIEAYQKKKAATKAEQAESKRKSVEGRIAEAQKHICKAFALAECPHLVVTQSATEFWPELAFEVEGIIFFFNLARGRVLTKTTCPKCGYVHSGEFRIETDKSGVRDLSDLGLELCGLERHDCPKDKPPSIPPPPPKTMEYRIDCAEVRFLEALNELVSDAVGCHEH